MEIVLAVLLLFGGFTMGSITADKGDDKPQSTMVMSKVDDVLDSNPVTQAMHQSDPARCQSDRAVMYRDLTVPYRGPIKDRECDTSDCEGDCQDE